NIETKYEPKTVSLEYGDKVTIVISVDGWTIGQGTWIVERSKPQDQIEKEEKEYKEEMTKILEQFEKQEQEREALETFQKQQQEEANKTWYQRLGDNIEDTWANVKG
ncbi:TPA: hypothetical protein TVQ99_001352, partial [Streptococcus equi subsp. zooepidemicus]|nr:hypothetical protein [Streptococcus equi subsp. zooepidemicus]